jgi:thioredoxin reductase (NADPH)
MIGAVAKTQWLPSSLERDANGYIRAGRDVTTWSVDREPFALETSIPGIFCAGDVRHGSVKRVASGVGEGSMAIAFIHEYLDSLIRIHKAAHSRASSGHPSSAMARNH